MPCHHSRPVRNLTTYIVLWLSVLFMREKWDSACWKVRSVAKFAFIHALFIKIKKFHDAVVGFQCAFHVCSVAFATPGHGQINTRCYALLEVCLSVSIMDGSTGLPVMENWRRCVPPSWRACLCYWTSVGSPSSWANFQQRLSARVEVVESRSIYSGRGWVRMLEIMIQCDAWVLKWTNFG